MRWISAFGRCVFLAMLLTCCTEVKAQFERLIIEDTVNSIRFKISPVQRVRMQVRNDKEETRCTVYGIRESALIVMTKKGMEEISFRDINTVWLRPKGAFGKTFLILEVLSVCINGIAVVNQIQRMGAHGDPGPFATLALAPVTLVALPLMGAGLLMHAVYPKEPVGYGGNYQWRVDH